MKKGSKYYSILHNRCPVCHEGKPFKYGAYSTRFAKMDDNCEVCDHKYEIENGFFYGAMYASYAITVAIMVAMFVAVYILAPNAGVEVYIGAVVIGVTILIPVSFRGSRLMWMNIFSKYKEQEKVQG